MKKIIYNPRLKKISRHLRKNMTFTEVILWKKISRRQILNFQFYRQRPIGNYIVDFFCPKAKFIIELDGCQHKKKKILIKDKERDEYFNNLGYYVMRFDDYDVIRNLDGVINEIWKYLKKFKDL